jgi:SAM-dependent methyltransferase
MDPHEYEAAQRTRSLIDRGLHDQSEFRKALLRVAPEARDAWLDTVLGLRELPEDGPDLPRDCVPYLPCPVDTLVRMVDEACIGPTDFFVDLGSGVGRATALVHLMTGAATVGVEIQRGLALAARELARRLALAPHATIEGDASALGGFFPLATVFFLYCPFSGGRLERTLAVIEATARTRPLRVCCVDLPLPSRPWLSLEPPLRGNLAVYRTSLHDRAFAA